MRKLAWTPWVCVAALLGGCTTDRATVVSSRTPPPAAEDAPGPTAVQAPPTRSSELRVGTSGDYAPFSTHDATGDPTGFDVELAQRLASDLGLTLRWVPFRWSDLQSQIASGKLDVAMSGVTWQPVRAVSGTMTRTVARGGPCILGDAAAPRIAVNHGGVLEAWARGHLADRTIVTVDDNTSLPQLLADGRAGAVVTDSFELKAFARPGWAVRCEPRLAQKVYWIAPARSSELGPRFDAWLRANTARVQDAQERWFGERQRLDAAAHLVDLLARRLAYMPLVAALKAKHGQPIEDLAREREVLNAVGANARRLGLPERASVDLFALQIALSKEVQRRQSEPSALDLGAQIRPALNELGDRILGALADAYSSHQLEKLTASDLEPLAPWLTASEREALSLRLRAIASN